MSELWQLPCETIAAGVRSGEFSAAEATQERILQCALGE